MTVPHDFPKAPNAPTTAYICSTGEIYFLTNRNLDNVQKATPGNWLVFDFKDEDVTLLPSKGICMLIEMCAL
jgi:hypothetical protein